MAINDYLELEGEEAFYGQGFGSDGYTSIWILTCDTKKLPYNMDWLQDLAGVNYYDLDFNGTIERETSWQEALEPLALSEESLQEVLRKIEELDTGNGTLVIQGDFHYDPSKVTRDLDSRLVFLGAFS